MRGGGPGPQASLYIHIPFCAGACDYCDFYSIPIRPDDRRIDGYVDAVINDLEKQTVRFGLGRIPTVYIGGGTPSLLGASRVERLLGGLESLGPFGEITVEANPESAGEEFLRVCRDRGVGRISLGVQSFHGPSRRGVGRVGEGTPLPERLALVSEYYGGSFSADLITGLPYQDESVVSRDIETLLSYGPGHVSLYALTVEGGTPLAEAVKGSPPGKPIPAGDEADRLWLTGGKVLEQAGYARYEVSNFALPGQRSAHNIRYWRMENWLGLGPGASGTLINDETGTGRRYTVKPSVDAYMAGMGGPDLGPPLIEEELDSPTLIRESLLMGFRYIEGPDEALFRRRFGGDIEELIPESLSRWRARGLVRRDRAAPTPEGMLFLNPFLVDVFAELERRGI
ncbi:MAG: coproporphyrinogen III oxidase family protein [Spirochaetaceae bacterium]|nr:coproporphyrinogen III oxidase family protein [Spirochaetaceae bacterium]